MKNYLFTLLAFVFTNSLFAQNISGVINNYTAVSLITGNVITVNSTTGFNVGDKVMLIKMKGASVDETNTSAFGDTISLGEAGNYVFSNIVALSPTTITINPYCGNFSNTNYLQLVSVPIYPNPTVTGILTCAPWNGSSGGILIFETPGQLTLNANIDVSTKGYLGGNDFGHTYDCSFTSFYSALSTHRDGKKGEGVAAYILDKESGRGKLANGGGGSYAGNAGAGGGANAGIGGNGGNEFSGCGASGFAGVGGQAITHKNSALLMGGGGGGPQNDNFQTAYNGGNGGGIAYIVANEIIGNGNSIRSNGGSVPTINDEGSSAGGAGGSVIVTCPNYVSTLQIETIGGNGGSNFNTIFPTNCHGTGGGGGGGITWLSTGSLPTNVTVLSGGGLAGMVLNPASSCYNTTYFAQNGGAGDVKYNFSPVQSLVSAADVYLAAKAILDGPYNASLGLMSDNLRSSNLIPLTEPYSATPYNKLAIGEAGGEIVSPSVLSTNTNNAIVDWIFLELRSPANPATVVANKRALIQRDGDIVSALDGVSPVLFTGTPSGTYYVSVKHRNHLGVMSASPVLFAACDTTLIDFRSGSVYVNPLLNNAPRKLVGSVYTLWAADHNNNKNVKYNGLSNDKDAVLMALGGPAFLNSTLSNVYRVEDGNMDGKIRYNNVDNDRIIVLNTVGVSTPNVIINQHTPN